MFAGGSSVTFPQPKPSIATVTSLPGNLSMATLATGLLGNLASMGTSLPELQDVMIGGVNHRLVHIGGKNRACAYCTISKNKTKLGWARKSYYKCNECCVPLCRGETNCYDRYHELVLEHQHLVDTPRAMYKCLLRKFSHTDVDFLPDDLYQH